MNNCSRCGKSTKGDGLRESYPEQKITCPKCIEEKVKVIMKIELLKEMIEELEEKIK